MIGLPTHLPEWNAWSQEIVRRIRIGGARDNLQSLVKVGCDEEELLFRLAAIVAWKDKKIDWRSTGLTPHLIRVAPDKLREAAGLVERFNNALAIRPKISASPEELSRSLWSFADHLEEITPLLLRPSSLTLEISALCSLVGYVTRVSKKPHDKEVSGLIGAVLGREYYAATHLTQWRSKHREAIGLFGSGIVSPLSQAVPSR
jgi:hypothetical protein